MKTFSAALAAAILTISVLQGAASTAPTVNKTWVSSTGTDTGSCQLVAPCKSFAYAIGQTNAGGEIDVKDSGAYGAFTISKDITIVAAGVVASVGIGSDNHAINIDTDLVKADIIGLTVNTHSIQKGYGVFVNCNQCIVSLDHMNIQGNLAGVDDQKNGLIIITNSHVSSNYVGFSASESALATVIYLGNNVITMNSTGLERGNFYSYGNNQINGNTSYDIGNAAYTFNQSQK